MSTSDVIVRLAYLSQKSKILKGADNWVGADNWWCHPISSIRFKRRDAFQVGRRIYWETYASSIKLKQQVYNVLSVKLSLGVAHFSRYATMFFVIKASVGPKFINRFEQLHFGLNDFFHCIETAYSGHNTVFGRIAKFILRIAQ